jgi:hypothetical protein
MAGETTTFTELGRGRWLRGVRFLCRISGFLAG